MGRRRSVRTVSDDPRPRRKILPLVFATTLTSIMGNSLLAPAIPDILDEFGQPDSSAGLLIAASSLPGIVVAPAIGLLADRFGRRAVLSPCLAIFGLASILAATAPTFVVLLIARCCMGFGAAGLVNLAVVLVSDHFEGDERTKWIGTNSGVLTVALAVFPVYSGAMTELAGWRWAIAPQSLGLVSALVAWRVLESGRPGTRVGVGEQLRGAGLALRQPAIAASVTAASITFAVIFGVFLAALPTHLDNEFGLGPSARGLVFGLPAITSASLAFNLGRVRRRVRAGSLLLGAACVWCVAFLFIGLAPSVAIVAVGALLYGAGEGVVIPTLQDAALSRAPDGQRAAMMASWTGAARLGQTVGPLIAAILLAGPGSGAALLAGSVGSGLLVALFATRPFDRDR